jgi:hypothetical protein
MTTGIGVTAVARLMKWLNDETDSHPACGR